MRFFRLPLGACLPQRVKVRAVPSFDVFFTFENSVHIVFIVHIVH